MSATFVLGTGVLVHLFLFGVTSLLQAHLQKSATVFQCDELYQNMSQGKVPLLVAPLIHWSSSVSVLNNKATLTSTLQTVY